MLRYFKKFLKVGSLLALAGYAFPVSADYPSLNTRPRMSSMGGAGVAGKGDQDSAMLNPAALADVEKSKINALPFLVEAPFDTGILSSFQDYNDVRTKESSTTEEKKAALESFLSDVASTAAAVRVNLYPSYTRPFFHMGFLADLYMEPKLRVGGLTSNQVVELGGSSGTFGLIMGGAYSFFENSLQVGVTLKPLYRIALTANQSQTLYDVLEGSDPGESVVDQIFGKNKASQRAFGVGGDIGVKYWIPYFEFLRPSVGLTLQDVGDTRFLTEKALPRNIPQSLSTGFAIHPEWKIFKNTLSIDFRNILKEAEFLNKLHVGLESVIWDLLALRLGLAQGYFTAGLGVMLPFFEADLYLTAREAGNKAHIQQIQSLGLRVALAF